MKRKSALFRVLGLTGLIGAVSCGFVATSGAVGLSRNAIQAVSRATVTVGDNARVSSVSCATAGNCAAGGSYRDGAGHTQVFVVDESNGIWGKAIEVPGSATLNRGGDARLYEVSCATVGNCAAAGFYKADGLNWQAFVVNETNGIWGKAIEVPGSATLNSYGDAAVYSVKCVTVGNCAAVGYYLDGSFNYQAFVVDETSGIWGSAIEVPGSATLNSGGDAAVEEVSCGDAGTCAAGGYYKDGSGHYQAFVVDETSGIWGTATEVPGSAALNSGGNAWVSWVSCPAAGTCAAAGYYKDASGHYQALVADETSGTWGDAIEVPGSATLNSGGDAWVNSVSCATAGNCSVGGAYRNGAGHQAFVANETNGSWGNAIEVPGSATLNTGGDAWVNSVSCATVGTCVAGGAYRNGLGHQAFVTDETNGSWGNAKAIRSTFPCVVPKLVGKTLLAAKGALAAAYCSVGTITRVYSTVRAGRVLAQRPKPGSHLIHGGKVALTVSKGRR